MVGVFYRTRKPSPEALGGTKRATPDTWGADPKYALQDPSDAR